MINQQDITDYLAYQDAITADGGRGTMYRARATLRRLGTARIAYLKNNPEIIAYINTHSVSGGGGGFLGGLFDSVKTFASESGVKEAIILGGIVYGADAAGLFGSGSAVPTTSVIGVAPSSAPLTITDTYAAMTSAAGLTTSGNIAADIALAGAVQSAALPVAAAQVYAASVAAGELAADAVVSGIAETLSAGSALTVADIVQGIPADAAKAIAHGAKAIVPAETVTEKIVDAAINVGGAVGTAALVGTLEPVKPKPAPVPIITDSEAIDIKLILAALATVGGLVFLT